VLTYSRSVVRVVVCLRVAGGLKMHRPRRALTDEERDDLVEAEARYVRVAALGHSDGDQSVTQLGNDIRTLLHSKDK